MGLVQTWRWYGPNDIVSLNDIEQAGATGIVNALHHVPVGEVWTVDEIQKRKKLIEVNEETGEPRNLTWDVVESLNIHESIRQGTKDRDKYIEKYKTSLENLAECGLEVVCYNFMPVLDWTRTDLAYKVKDGSLALRYDAIALAAFDLFILEREAAPGEYSEDIIKKAEGYFAALNEEQREELKNSILQGLPGTFEVLSIEDFRRFLREYQNIDAEKLKENLKYFLEQVIPTAEEVGIRLCIHPDDPPFPIFGLPRIVSTEEDLEFLTRAVESPSNGITFCTGSLGPRIENDLPGIVRRLGHKFHFVHLRNVQRQEDGSFYEADHLGGSVDMYAVMLELVKEVKRREEEGRKDTNLPFRPDHGHQMLDDLNKKIPFYGYSAIGRLRGLAELRGLELGIRRMFESQN